MSYKFTYAEEDRIKSIALKLIRVTNTNSKLRFTDKELFMIRRMAMIYQTDETLLVDTWMKVNPNMNEEEAKYTLKLMLSDLNWKYKFKK